MKRVLLSVLFAIPSIMVYSQCSDLIISEYVEGSGNNKGVEIYNPTPNAINLSNYHLVRYSNGSTVGSDSLALTGTLASGDVWVVINGQTTSQPNSPACDPTLQAMADQLDGAYPAPTYWNGNDAFAIVKISPTYSRVDIFGKIGEDPGQSWTDIFPYTDAQGAYWTKDHTLRRKATVMQGVTTNPSAFNATVEWDSLPKDTWTGLGMHTCNCPLTVQEFTFDAKMSVYPNPSGNGTITLQASEAIVEIEIINSVGQVVKTVALNNQEKSITLSTSGLQTGLYILNVKFREGSLTSKITLQ